MKFESLTEQQQARLLSAAANVLSVGSEVRPALAPSPAAKQLLRKEIAAALLAKIEELEIDETEWESMSANDSKLLYDVYLEMREMEGIITPYDLTRPGLLQHKFSSEYAWLQHRTRIAEDLLEGGSVGSKRCAQCGNLRPLSSFRKRGGAVCSSCRGKNYRANAKTKASV